MPRMRNLLRRMLLPDSHIFAHVRGWCLEIPAIAAVQPTTRAVVCWQPVCSTLLNITQLTIRVNVRYDNCQVTAV